MQDASKTSKSLEELSKLVKEKISEFLGVESEDIDDDDSLTEDFHMKPSDLFELTESFKESEIDTSKLNLTEVSTVGELIEALGDNEYLD